MFFGDPSGNEKLNLLFAWRPPTGRHRRAVGKYTAKIYPNFARSSFFFGFTHLKQHCVLDFCAKMTPKIQKLVTLNPAGCYIDQNLTCDIPIEQSFYKAPFGSWQCYNCACDIKEQNIIDQIEEKLLSFSTVKPSCSSKCGPMITKFPRKVRKNKSGGSGRPKKKARRWNGATELSKVT